MKTTRSGQRRKRKSEREREGAQGEKKLASEKDELGMVDEDGRRARVRG